MCSGMCPQACFHQLITIYFTGCITLFCSTIITLLAASPCFAPPIMTLLAASPCFAQPIIWMAVSPGKTADKGLQQCLIRKTMQPYISR
ncbi:hypothetical protein MRB53_008670 [Persea americana]|uniref:Uncharacterized protein n=1 Tax=Persea americana TaxID=3435 RepID=A0ACC2MPY9_PERAE|nr:hypothetical protein MRB53_008670 [Persea americana]